MTTASKPSHHIAYWNGWKWIPWCEFENVTPTHEVVSDEGGEICADCLALALEEASS